LSAAEREQLASIAADRGRTRRVNDPKIAEVPKRSLGLIRE
jgi:hypothetical protein